MASNDQQLKKNLGDNDKKILFNIISKYYILQCKKTDAPTNAAKNVAWEEICLEFNNKSLIKKTVMQIKTIYKNNKEKFKKNQEDLASPSETEESSDIIKRKVIFLPEFIPDEESEEESYTRASRSLNKRKAVKAETYLSKESNRNGLASPENKEFKTEESRKRKMIFISDEESEEESSSRVSKSLKRNALKAEIYLSKTRIQETRQKLLDAKLKYWNAKIKYLNFRNNSD